MRSFKDNEGREWTISINVTSIKKIKASSLAVDLLDIMDGKLMNRFADDPILFIDVIWLLCEEQAQKLEVTDEEFGRGMAGDALDKASEAFLEELVDFFPKSKRDPLKTVLRKSVLMQDLVMQRAILSLEKPEVEAMLLEKTDREVQKAIDQFNEFGE